MTVQTTTQAPPLATIGDAGPPSRIGASVARYAEEIGQCMALAEQIVDTPIVPAAYWPPVAIEVGNEAKILKHWEWDPRRKHPRESAEDYAGRRRTAIATTGGVVHVGITLGHESYYQSIAGIYFVGGRPALMSEEMRSAVLRAGHYFRVVERGDKLAAVEVLRRGEKGEPRRYVFTMDDAERAGYVPGKGPNVGTNKWGKENKGGNEKYVTDPATMLLARATTVACKVEFPDVIRGLAPDERLDDPVDITATTTVHVTASDITGQPAAIAPAPSGLLAQAAERKPEPALAPVEQDPIEAAAEAARDAHDAYARDDAPGTVTDAQLRKLGVLMGQLEVTGTGSRERRLAIAGRIAGRALESSRDLTRVEASLVIDLLDGVARLSPSERAVRVSRIEQGLPVEPSADHQAEPAPDSTPPEAPAPVEAEQDLEPPADDPWRDAPQVQG